MKLLFTKKELGPLFLVSLLNVTGWNMLSAYGVSYMHAGRAVIIGFTMPVWASVLGVLILGERLDLRRLLGLGFGMAGLAILFGPDMRALGSHPMSSVLMLGSAVSLGGGHGPCQAFSLDNANDGPLGVAVCSGGDSGRHRRLGNRARYRRTGVVT